MAGSSLQPAPPSHRRPPRPQVLPPRRRARRSAWLRQQARHSTRPRHRLRRWLRWSWSLLPTGLLLLATTCLAIRLTVQDTVPGLPGYLYYMSSPATLTVLAALATACWLLSRQWRLLLIAGLCTLTCAIWTRQAMFAHNPPAAITPAHQSVVFWNVAWGRYGWSDVAREMQQMDADVFALVESTATFDIRGMSPEELNARREANAAARQAWFAKRFPDYHSVVTRRGLSVLSRHPILSHQVQLLGADYYTAFGWTLHVELDVPDGPLHLYVVDVANAFRRSRAAPIKRLYEHLSAPEDRPVLVVGDFNTPIDSVHMQPLRQRLNNAFELAGDGYAATWPLPLPLIVIDQAWYNEYVDIARCDLGWTGNSDHRPIQLHARPRTVRP